MPREPQNLPPGARASGGTAGPPAAGSRARARRYALTATQEAVRRTLMRIERDLATGGGEETLRVRVVLAAAEALNNVVEHGGIAGRTRRISVKVVPEGDRIRLVMTDPGRPARLPDHDDPNCPDAGDHLEDAPEGGFGLFLIHTLSDRVTRERVRGRNRLEMEFS